MKKGENLMKYLMTYGWAILIVIIVAAALYALGVFDPENYKNNTPHNETNMTEPVNIGAFTALDNDMCLADGKPAVYLFSSSGCPHCTWIGPIFDEVATDYVDDGLISAYHLQLDTRVETLTNMSFDDFNVTDEVIDVYIEQNPMGAVPAMLFGCRYFSLGATHEREEDGEQITREEFREVIDALLAGKPAETVYTMSLAEAIVIALNSECVEGDTSLEYTWSYNDATNTYWFDLDIEKEGCNPACVVDAVTGDAEINYRCTGLVE